MIKRINFEEQVNLKSIERPHLVILGAGATLAALPNGDKNGKTIPLMNNLVSTVNLEPILEKHSVKVETDNFESLYSSIYESNPTLAQEMENKIYNYFSSLQITDELTIYDYLILFLRKKDCIATFNWDPILIQALARNAPTLDSYGLEPPKILFLHGNTQLGVCSNRCSVGPIEEKCDKCNQKYIRSPLLYPIAKKDYSKDSFIDNQWKRVQDVLEKSYLLTIFGYSAPDSDQEAMELFKKGWGNKEDRKFEEIEIINTGKKDLHIKKWKNLIHTHHYRYKTDFFQSLMAKYPRRSCECFFQQSLQCNRLVSNTVPKNDDVYNFLNPLMCKESNMTRIKMEIKRQKDGKILRTIEEAIGGSEGTFLRYAKVSKTFHDDRGYEEITEGDFVDIIFESSVIDIEIICSNSPDDDPSGCIRMPPISLKCEGKCTYRLILSKNMRFSITTGQAGWDKRYLGMLWETSDEEN